jgi:hypothetical protein
MQEEQECGSYGRRYTDTDSSGRVHEKIIKKAKRDFSLEMTSRVPFDFVKRSSPIQ